MRLLATALLIGVMLFYGIPALRRSRDLRHTRRLLRSAGSSYSQLGSVHPHRPGRISTTFWFIMAACVLILGSLWLWGRR